MRSGIRVMAFLGMIAAAFLAAWPAGAAYGDKNSWEAGLFVGYDYIDDYEGIRPRDDAFYGARLGYFFSPEISLEVSYQALGTTTTQPWGEDVDFSSVRLNGLYNWKQGEHVHPYLTFGFGMEDADFLTLEDTNDFGMNLGGGFRYLWKNRFGLRYDVRAVIIEAGGVADTTVTNLETSLGFTVAFGGGTPPDTDGDGVIDRKDKCPDTPRGATVDVKGCPHDADGDKVWDGIDTCPDTPAGCPVDDKGCPIDTDGDGVVDCKDSCADTVNGCTVDEKGCPADADGDKVCDGVDTCPGTARGCSVDATGCPADADGDKVCDGVDACPGTAKGCTVDEKGCPADADGDKVCDGVDACPGTPAGTPVDARGCGTLFEKQAVLVLEGVTFDTGSDRLKAESTAILDKVAESIRLAGAVKVEVAGHTDAQGGDASNLKLSQRRADAVREYLVSKGVDGSRLTAKGYGESAPVADNATSEGRAKNRRVELRKLD